MRKIFLFLFITLFLMSFGLCTLVPDVKTDGLYLIVSANGNYFNEVTGNTSTSPTNLEAIINLYPISKSSPSGHFGQGEGIVTGAASGNLTEGMTFGGSAHVNGLIAKGPFSENSPVVITLADANLNPIEIDPVIIDFFEGTVNNVAEFNFDLPATNDVDIFVNVNILSTMQSKRIKTLVTTTKLPYAEAYNQSKQEILDIFNVGNEIENILDFDELKITGNTTSDAFLVMTSAIFSDNADKINDIISDVADNGEVNNSESYTALKNSMMNINIQSVIDNLTNYYEDLGQTVTIPGGGSYLDSDGDGVIDMYELALISPLGFVSGSTNSFDWTDVVIPGATVTYNLEVADNFNFVSPVISQTGLSSSEFTGVALTPSTQYYWRVKPVVNGIEKDWSSTSSFYTAILTSLMGSVTDFTAYSRAITVKLFDVIGASTMSFSTDDVTYTTPQPFELYKTLIVPEEDIENVGGVYRATLYCEFTNGAMTLNPSAAITFFLTPPTGNFYILGMDYPSTESLNVSISISYISGATEMRFSNENNIFGDESGEEWKSFAENNTNWTLVGPANISGIKTVYAEFKNPNGVIQLQDTIQYNAVRENNF